MATGLAQAGWRRAGGALAAAGAVGVPAWVGGAAAALPWMLLAGSLAALCWRVCARRELLLCMAAVAAGLALDFARLPPATLLAVCRAAAAPLDQLLFHVRWLQVTGALMVLLLVARRPTLAALPRVAGDVALMLVAMTGAMAALRCAAAWMSLEWGPAGMAASMVTGMLAFLALEHGAGVAQARWRLARAV